jgi:hypothetical protein
MQGIRVTALIEKRQLVSGNTQACWTGRVRRALSRRGTRRLGDRVLTKALVSRTARRRTEPGLLASIERVSPPVRVLVARGNRGKSAGGDEAARCPGRPWARATASFRERVPVDDFSSIGWSWFT